MKPQTKIIVVEGKKVLCRKLQRGEFIHNGDWRPVIGTHGKEHYQTSCGRCKVLLHSDIFYRPIKPRPKRPSGKVRVKSVKAWACVKRDGSFTLQDICSTRERAQFETGRWNDHETCPGIQDERKRVLPVLITPLPLKKGRKK